MDVEIRTLDVRLEVEGGNEDEAAFAKLFEKYIARWSQRAADEVGHGRLGARERSLGDRGDEDVT